jgi:predicted transcriptional regulator
MPKSDRSAKDDVVAIVQGLPEDSSYDDIVRELVFNRMVERGLADVEAGRTVSDDEMERSIESWRKG